MKNVIDYIKKSYFDEIYLNSIKDYFNDDLPEAVFECIETGNYRDFILENLQSHDIKLLCKKIRQKFGNNNIISFLDINDKNTSMQLASRSTIDMNELKNLLDFFGYYVTKTFKDDSYNNYIISPVYSSDANELVYVKNHGKLYHFTTGENSKEIERTGLRCKSAKYRRFPERIYVYSSCKKLDQIPDLSNKIKSVINPIEAKKHGVYVYRIDLNKAKNDICINFYDDDIMNDKDAVYTYNNIPPECISLVKTLDY